MYRTVTQAVTAGLKILRDSTDLPADHKQWMHDIDELLHDGPDGKNWMTLGKLNHKLHQRMAELDPDHWDKVMHR